MPNRITTQDIADALGVSRNTVSKAINNSGILSEATRQKVIEKAKEMGYRQFSWITTSSPNIRTSETHEKKAGLQEKKIILLSSCFLNDSHFSSPLLDKFKSEIAKAGYTMQLELLSDEDIKNKTLPIQFNRDQVAGIICFEIFDPEYAYMLCDQNIPILFVDTPVLSPAKPLNADRLYMENQTGLGAIIQSLVNKGKKTFGFVGEIHRCQSFMERYLTFRITLELAGYPADLQYSLTAHHSDPSRRSGVDYRVYLSEQIEKMNQLPEVFICANDFVAFDLINVLHSRGYCVPGDVLVAGFDDSPESKLISPNLTSVHIHTQIMGFSAADLILSRIDNPFLNYRTVYTETTPVWRESTDTD
ncbi:LacI family DNA-binding transcriptional regulator [Ileibacterium valens]|uniref:LacI family DNA-binding transcriptional regulator n=1 Tax=Ileibacterium valens TaxID=1862668 RepID=UPI003512782C